MDKFDQIVYGALSIANSEALKRKNNELTPEHLLLGLIKNPSSYSFEKLKDSLEEILDKLSKLPELQGDIQVDSIQPSAKLREWLTMASGHATEAGRDTVRENDLLRFLPQIFSYLKINYADFNTEEEVTEVPHFLINLNELAENGKLDPVIGRSKEIRSVMEILGRRGKNNPVLVGPAGVGKTAIVEGLAEAIVKENVPNVLLGKVVMSLDMGALMAGTKFRGEFEERLQGLIKYLKEKSGEVILFIDEIHQLVGAGKTDGAMDAANLLKPALARGELHCIGATTTDEYKKYILGDSALDRRFRSVTVNEPTVEDSIEILMGLKEKLEIFHGIKISDESIYSAAVLSDQYITDKNLPDKAIDLVDEASSALKLSAEAMPSKLVELESEIRSKMIYAQFDKDNKELENELQFLQRDFDTQKKLWEDEVSSVKRISDIKNNLDRLKFDLDHAERNQNYEEASRIKFSLIPELEKEINNSQHDWILLEKDIAQVISRQTGIPIEKILKSKQEKILELKSYLEQEVFGQTAAIDEIAECLVAAHAGLSDESRPLGSFLLKGPSGVGKTEMAKAISRFLFNTEKNIIRIDMSEYSEKHSIAKLIGSPAGYVGYDDGGILTEAVRRHPYAIILFDEIEKAHYDFADLLLQILDDGRLTDNKGRTIDFKNTIIFATTNSKNIESDFKSEVLGRLDSVIEFSELDDNIMKKLIEKQLKLLNQRLADKDITIELDKELEEELCQKGLDPRYGARPLHSIFNKLVIRPLAHKILSDNISNMKLEVRWIQGTQKVSYEQIV